MLYGDIAWVPSHVRQQAAMVRLWIRLTQMPRSRLARQVFEWDYSHARRGTWCYDMIKLFESCGMLDTYLNKCDDPSTQRVHTSLHQVDISQRRNDMTAMSRMSLYRHLADAPTFTEPARYTCMPLRREQRTVIAKLHSGTLPLLIETGRYKQACMPAVRYGCSWRRKSFLVLLSSIRQP